MISGVVFYSLAAVILVSALGTVLLRNVLHSALLLGLSLAGVAGIYACLASDFLFAAQILIYVGGIAVLILFVVLLSGRHSDLNYPQVNEQWLAATAIASMIFWAVHQLLIPFMSLKEPQEWHPATAGIADLLLKDLAVPFELVSLVLLAALVGAVLFSKTEEALGPTSPPQADEEK